MNVFERLASLYEEIDQFYVAQELTDGGANVMTSGESISRKRELNDHAYFLFMFTRLEDHVREESSQLIRQKSDAAQAWTDRRVWQLLPSAKNADQPSFMDRVALLLDKSTHHYGEIKEYYKLRNTIGHGGNFTTPISMPTVVRKFSRYLELMKADG